MCKTEGRVTSQETVTFFTPREYWPLTDPQSFTFIPVRLHLLKGFIYFFNERLSLPVFKHIIKQIKFSLYKSFWETALKLEKVTFYIHYSPHLLDMILMTSGWENKTKKKNNKIQAAFNRQCRQPRGLGWLHERRSINQSYSWCSVRLKNICAFNKYLMGLISGQAQNW